MSPEGTCQFVVNGEYSDGSAQDVTDTVTWSSSAVAVAKVSNGSPSAGLVTAVDGGTATITATLQRVTTSAPLTVSPRATLVAIEIFPSPGTVAVGETQPFTAIGVYSDTVHRDLTLSVSWSSADNRVARIDRSGLALGVKAGTTSITATCQKASSSVQLTVS